MRVLRIVRGMIGAALAFAVPWAVMGSALAAAIEALWPGASAQGPMPEFYIGVAQSGAFGFGALGGLAGALYALMLALAGRRLSFEELTVGRVLGLGAAGGVVVGAVLFGSAGVYFGIWPVQYSIGVGIAAALGAGSALALLAWARRSPERPGSLPPGGSPDPALMAAAHEEIELLLRDDVQQQPIFDRPTS